MTTSRIDSISQQTACDWRAYFDKAIAERSDLEKQTIEELESQLLDDYLMLALVDDLPEADQQRIIIEKVDQLLSKYPCSERRKSCQREVSSGEMQSMHRIGNQKADSFADDARKKSELSASVSLPLHAAYPALPICLKGLTQESLVERSIRVASQFRHDRDYNAIRTEFLHVSLALNQLGILAPVFRDQPKMPYKKSEQENYTQLLIDQIVIDLHWLYCRKERLLPRWPELKTLLQDSHKFDCDRVAGQLGRRRWSCDFRVSELITVCPRQQAQLMQLRSKEMKNRFRTLLEGNRELEEGKRIKRTKAEVSAVRMAIASWADGNHRVRGQEEVYESIWLAMRLLGPKTKPKEIASLVALRCGVKPLDRKTMTEKIATLRRVLDEAGIPHGV